MSDEAIFIGGGGANYATAQQLLLKYANRHGLIAGATGTGKTVTLQIMAEAFSAQGVPVFLSDVKGDLSGLAEAGSAGFKLHDAFMSRAQKIGLAPYEYRAFPVSFWDIFGEKGHPIRATVTEMGPVLLSRLLELTEAQEGALTIAFRLADEEGMDLLDLKDLQALLVFAGENADQLQLRYGNIAAASIGAIQRRLLVLEDQGGAGFFGEPALELADLMRCDADGRGVINILAADRLMMSPRLYATALLWLLSELFETLPEVGDPDKPKLVFFFDEAHLLFNDAPKALVEKVEQVARLIRSKGVGVYFVTQNPADVPDEILGQLGNRVQHALRAFTAKDQKDLRQAADTYRPNPNFDTAEAIREVGVGEAVVSFLEAKGAPSVVERCLIRPPSSKLGPMDEGARQAMVKSAPLQGKYGAPLDRESAYEILQARAAKAAAEAEVAAAREVQEVAEAEAAREFTAARRYTAGGSPKREAPSRGDSFGTAFAKSFARQMGTRAGRAVMRGVLGALTGR